jgi:hypothetical protein
MEEFAQEIKQFLDLHPLLGTVTGDRTPRPLPQNPRSCWRLDGILDSRRPEIPEASLCPHYLERGERLCRTIPPTQRKDAVQRG